jgi:large subunit ribosomal protein L18
MKISPTYRLPFRRKIEGKTDYKRRLKLLQSGKPRLVVRRSLNSIRAQIIVFDEKGDRTIASANSRSLKKIGWSFACDSIPAAYLVGLAIGKTALKNNISEVVLDLGLYRATKGGRVYAVAKGALDAGLKVPSDAGVFPSEYRISGKHIAAFKEKFKDLPAKFEEIKQMIMGS